MITRLANLWDRLMGSFWFLPTLMLVAAMLLGGLLPVSENKSWISVRGGDWLHTTPAGAKRLVGDCWGNDHCGWGGVFHHHGHAFHRVVAIRLACAPPSIARSRDADGSCAFLGTTVYCLFVLLHVEEVGPSASVPHLSVLVGIGLAVASTFVLIYFIHDVAESVRRLILSLVSQPTLRHPSTVCIPSGLARVPAMMTRRHSRR